MRRKWRGEGRILQIEVLSPYQTGADRAAPFERLSDGGVDLVVLDCMGYSLEIQQLAASGVDAPVILSNRLVGAVIESMTF